MSSPSDNDSSSSGCKPKTSNNNNINNITNTNNVNTNTNGYVPSKTNHTLTEIIDSIPAWNIVENMINGHDNGQNDFLAPWESPNGSSIDVSPIGSSMKAPRVSPESTNNNRIVCCWCEINATTRCIECNEFMCNECLREHRQSPVSINHSIVHLPSPIGTSPTNSISPNIPTVRSRKYVCEQHNDLLHYVCNHCRKLICQFCTMHEHSEHSYIPVQIFVQDSNQRIQMALESGRQGKKYIKASIDKTLVFIRHIERNCGELGDNIRKAFREYVNAVEERERILLDFVERLRQRRLALLHEQMAGLKSTLTGLSETNDELYKLSEVINRMDQYELATKVTNGQRQLEQFAAVYKDLTPRQEVFFFVPPDYNTLQEIRNQGSIVLVDEKNVPHVNVSGGTIVGGTASIESIGTVLSMPNSNVANCNVPANIRRPLLRDNSFRNPSPVMQMRVGSACSMPNPVVDWELNLMRSSPGLHFGAPRSTPAIPGSMEPVKARKSTSISISFATEGHDDGQVSRPWGLCVDKYGHILVSDRRNNRVQVFHSDGNLRFKFGRKGVGNGEFDLPAGICVDIDNRIIVVDKDNHRVQIFSSSGVFLLKFGSYGKEYGQFQYPWDVAVNARRQIVVTDSRNHRIQQFDSEGRFIRQIVFDSHGSNKGIASPRGVCYTPTGNIIVSDFDNHCLYLIDPDINDIISTKGHEGSGVQEFNRPSGICCDDDGRIIVADSKNQRIVVYSPSLDFLWAIEIRPSLNSLMPSSLEEKDRTCDVALMPDGRIVFLIELSPDSKEGSNPFKRFVHIF